MQTAGFFGPELPALASVWKIGVEAMIAAYLVATCSEPLLPFGIVDTHVHLMTTTNGLNYTWTKPTPPQSCPCRPPCTCNMSLPEYAAASAATAPADAVVFCEVSTVAADWLKEARWVQSLALHPPAGVPQIGAIMAQPPPGFGTAPVASYAADLDLLAAQVPLLRGVRAYLNAPNATLLRAGLAEMGRRGLVVDTFVPRITDSRVHDTIALTPGTTYNVEHFGCGCDVSPLAANASAFDEWRASLRTLSSLPNIGCLQLGGTMAGFGSVTKVDAAKVRPLVAAAVETFGYARMCFEANWFFSNWVDSLDGFGEWVRMLVPMLKDLGATADELRMVFRDNARRVYRIK